MKVVRRPLAAIPPADSARLAGGSFFASPGFLALWAARGGRAIAWTLESHGELAALVPGVEFGRGPFTRFVSGPDGCYGGAFVAPALARHRTALAAVLLRAIARHGYAKAWVFDFERALAPPTGFERTACATTLVDIGAPDWEPRDAGLRGQLRRAARLGLAIEPFRWSAHADGLAQLLRCTARVHGARARYPLAFYRGLAGLAARDPRVLWLWCERDGRPVSSHIYFVERGMLQAWQTCMDRRWSTLKPHPSMRLHACRLAAARGIHTLNLGATPAGALGLAAYKARWGGTPVTYPAWTHAGAVGRLADAVRGRERDERVRPAWRGDPVPGTVRATAVSARLLS